MANIILTDVIASITELKVNPMATFKAGNGEAVAILNHNEPAFYCVPPKLYEYLMELADEAELVKIVQQRENEEEISVTIEELRNGLQTRF